MSLVSIIAGLIAQKVFITTLGVNHLGVNSLFTSILSMLDLAELGLGPAIVYHLYGPLAQRNNNRIKSLMRYYRKCYQLVAFSVAILGVAIMPFLKIIVRGNVIPENIYIVFGLFLFNAVSSYLLAYKRSLLYADQKSYVISSIHLGYIVMLNVSQIILLIITHNYYLYLIVMIVASILENIYVAIVVNKTYPQVLDKNARALSSNMKNDIRKKLKGLIYHKIGAYVVFGTDSILIAIFLGVKTVGLYGNYNLVIGALGSIVSQAFNGITGSVGNLLVTSVNRESFIVYKRLHFFNYWMSTIVSIGFLVCIDSFISLWIGKEFILSFGVVMAISINLYLQLNRSAVSVFKDAAGIFHEDRFVPVIESVVNLALCIFFLHLFGLVGVIMGTICSTLILYLFSYPRYLYVDLLSGKYWDYYKEFIKSIIITFLAGTLTYVLARQVHNTNAFLELVLNITVALIVPNTILYALLRKTDEFVYYKRMLLKYLKKILPHSRSI